jgi:hypothetical protein
MKKTIFYNCFLFDSINSNHKLVSIDLNLINYLINMFLTLKTQKKHLNYIYTYMAIYFCVVITIDIKHKIYIYGCVFVFLCFVSPNTT